MNLLSLSILVFIAVILSTSNGEICKTNTNLDNVSHLPNEVFRDVVISTVEDLIWNITQLDILFVPTADFAHETGTILINSNEKFCEYHSEHKFNLDSGGVTVPESSHLSKKLIPGCNYTIIFSVGKHCTFKYYKIPEPKPCQNYLPEDIFDSFPNKVMDYISVNAFKNNAIRLNISFLPKTEFENRTGYVVINSKIGKCSHPEEFTFNLAETDLIVPRAEHPHSFIESGCNYMIDFEIGKYCITTTYEVPDFCSANQPQVQILEIEKQENDIYIVYWLAKGSTKNRTDDIIDINYRLDNVSYEEFNKNMVINYYQSNYSLLNLSRLSEKKYYRLEATFVNSKYCSSSVFTEFEVSSGYKILLQLFVLICILFSAISITCIYTPTWRAKIVIIFKVLFGVTVQVPPIQQQKKFIGDSRREEFNPIYLPMELQNCDEFEITRDRIKIRSNEIPKSGNFGIVYFGTAPVGKNKCDVNVAIKTLKDNAPPEDVDALREEISTLKKITSHGNHENIVRLLGCCTIRNPSMMILELVSCGDLKSYLIDLRHEWSSKVRHSRFLFPSDNSNGSYISPTTNRSMSESSSNCLPSPTETESTILDDESEESLLSVDPSVRKNPPALSNVELENFASQIAKGMEFLESISIVHRDLAARNVLINDMKVLKISDFGMSRIGDYVHRNTKQQPLRWMALESIEKFVCTSKSDVWSFGVVLWEIGTLGAFPYESIPNDCILEYLLYSLKKNIRLMRPEICTDELYSLMLKCWCENPEDRPSFKKIVEHFSGDQKRIYLDFQKLNPAYVFPPTK